MKVIFIVKIDELLLDFVTASPKVEQKSKDFEMVNGDVVRYTRRKNALSLSCKGLIEKSELDTLLSMTDSTSEFTVEYTLNGQHTAHMLMDAMTYKKLMINDNTEYWEVSFNLKECKR